MLLKRLRPLDKFKRPFTASVRLDNHCVANILLIGRFETVRNGQFFA